MITSLLVNNIVLIDHLELNGSEGLAVLTGETGAGKSILLDALGLVLGGRAESKLVGQAHDQASVTACFDLKTNHPALALLAEKEIDTSEGLILRRTLNKDGRSKAFINDFPVSVQLLKEVGDQLVEIHGQFQTQGLLNSETHCRVLDAYAGISSQASQLREIWRNWRAAAETLEQAKADIENMRLQEEYLQYTVKELEELSPEKGEEELLAAKRKKLLNRDKMRESLEQSSALIDDENGLQFLFGKLQTLIEKTGIDDLIATTERAGSELTELSYQLEAIKNQDDSENGSLEEIENRYFALKDCAKKHRCSVDNLSRIHEELAQKLRLITHQDDALADLEKKVTVYKDKFISLAEQISLKRQKAAIKLGNAVNKELPELKLDKAKFAVNCTKTDEAKQWGANGFDKVCFVVATNPQSPAGPINKIASGGELSRFMLALKVVLAELGAVPTLIFDEVDSGIGGATADAVGERLAKLSDKYQILVVTHSPQVASRANNHWVITKSDKKGSAITEITRLENNIARAEEIARMISGAKITAEARAAAAKLLESVKAHAA